MISVTWKAQSDRRVASALATKKGSIVSELTLEMKKLMVDLQRVIQRKLSGEVLKTHGGARGLLGTVRLKDVVQAGDQITGGVQAGGGPAAAYARVQEEGGQKWYDIYPGIVTGKSDKKALAFFPTGSEGAGPGRLLGLRLYRKQGKNRGTLRPEKGGGFSGFAGL